MSKIPLLCFPFGGAGAGFFRQWTAHESVCADVIPVQLPGREERFREQAHARMSDALADLAPTVTALAAGHERVALFGHCLGAALAYELAHALRSDARVRVACVIVSGALAPSQPQRRVATGLPDPQFVAHLRESGYDLPVFDDPELLEIVMPTLRADVELTESYRPSTGAPLDVPICALRGADDDQVGAADIAAWSRFTSAPFKTFEIPGEHMYLSRRPLAALRLVDDALAFATG